MSALHRTRGEGIEGKPRPVPPMGRFAPGADEAPDLSPADLLGLEHDLIRRVVGVLERQSARFAAEEPIDAVFLARIVDFFVTYADRVHHGKEEEILFQRLHERSLSVEHRQMMEELAREHVEMRRAAVDLRRASERYRDGETEGLDGIRDQVERLASLYPAHVETEDESFFPIAMEYLDEADQRAVLEEMQGHDQAMIHEKYGSLAEELDAVTEDWALRE